MVQAADEAEPVAEAKDRRAESGEYLASRYPANCQMGV
jgi:hypothetical protein